MKHIVEDGFKDTMQGRIVDGSGKNLFREEETPFRSQEALYNHYLNENI
jgi:polyphosphate kinase